MKYHIICRVGKKDKYSIKGINKDNSTVLPFLGNQMVDRSIRYNTFNLLSSTNLIPNGNTIDLLITSIAAFSADKIVSRSKGFEDWSRYFVVHLPVVDIKVWEKAKDKLQKMLSFLSGDHWEFELRERKEIKIKGKKKKQPVDINKVCLFSGGLDSYIGIVDLLEKYSKDKIALVSKHGQGQDESKPQDRIIKIINNKYSQERFLNFKFFISAYNSVEPTTRSRSILFLAHGIAVAHALGKDVPLYVPENGLISLNIPLNPSRMGSSSTRTTHPYFISLFREVIKILGMENPILNPYQFITKGEMIIDSMAPEFIKQSAKETMSCSHPSVGRYKYRVCDKHCGYCVPCIIRRAAMNKAKIDTPKEYNVNILKNALSPKTKAGQDLRAFQMAIERWKQNKISPLLQVLASGPLPCSVKDKKQYAEVYIRGMNEVATFLREINGKV
ncbi:ATPase [candidate division KSB1 bacterium]|nr:ATPase [candidate division KSB1 bacterium]